MKNKIIMKNFLHTTLVTLLITNAASAQTVYNITADVTISGAKIPVQCSNCVINISKGVTLTINKDLNLKNTVFNGGTILANQSITFASDGGFNDTKVIVAKKAGLTASGALSVTNSSFDFAGTSKATFGAPLTMNNSKMIFEDNSTFEATKVVDLKNNSILQAGDGTTTSKALIFFNGGTLNIYDNSRVTVANTNNYYRNWNNYNSISNNKSYQTTNNNINCGTAGKNTCDAANVYGPSTLNFAGVASSAVLPVKLSSFSVRLNGSAAEITWTTDMELNSDRFEIERSLDGINWVKIGSVKSKGNSTIVNKYSFTEVLKLNGTVSYRLKMVDQDETSAYSAIKTLKPGSAVEMNIFPNPAVNYIVVNSNDNTNKTVQLFSLSGQMLKQVNGSGNINIPVNEFQAGNYIVRVVDADGTAKSFKLMIKK